MNPQEELVAAIEDYVARAMVAHLETFLPKLREQVASLDRRVSRHSEHLNRIQDRLAAIDTKGSKG